MVRPAELMRLSDNQTPQAKDDKILTVAAEQLLPCGQSPPPVHFSFFFLSVTAPCDLSQPTHQIATVFPWVTALMGLFFQFPLCLQNKPFH